jgi:hypothetical protein
MCCLEVTLPRTILALAAAGLVVSLAVPAPASAQAPTAQRTFVQGGTVHLDLSAGEYAITPSPDDTIRVAWRTDDPDDDVDVRIDIRGSRADVEIDGASNDGVHVQLQLPRRTNVVVELSAGELSLSGIEGGKDVSVRAGEVRISVGDREQYRRVDASVRIGEIAADAFDVNKGGFFRSFEWTGKGQYDLRAQLTVGELRLER